MTVAAQVSLDIRATKSAKTGLTSSVSDCSYRISIDGGGSTKTYRSTYTFPASGAVDIGLISLGFSAVKLLCLKNNSTTSSIALAAGWGGSDFRNFIVDTQAWNFAPMINLGSLTLRGYPVRQGGTFLIACPNTEGFATSPGGDILRVGGVSGQSFELYAMGV